MRELIRRIGYLMNRRRLDSELESDMEFHREMAARAGRSNFGNTLRIREQAQEAWGWTWLDRLMQDLRFATRILFKSPGFTLTAVLVLAIGIGVNVSAFSLFDMVALKPLPLRDPERIVRLERRSQEIFNSEMPYQSVLFYRDHVKTLSGVMAVLGMPPVQLDEDVQPTSVLFITPNYFSELGTPAGRGRLFDPAREADESATPVAVLSYGLWQRRFGGDPAVVGRIIRLNRKPAMIIGVTPYAFASLGGQTPDIWLPMAEQPYFVEGSTALTDWEANRVRMWGRLAPGVSAEMAAQELLGLTNDLRRQHPKAVWDHEFIVVEPGGHLQVMTPAMYNIAAMVAVLTLLILAVACANLGGLLLARAVTREHEIGIRVAIGASRGRIFRQLCTESLLLAMLGSSGGLLLSYVVLSIALSRLNAAKWLTAAPDWRVLLFTFGIAVLSAGFFGLTPALQIARQKQKKAVARQILIGAQVAASCMLLIVAGLLIRATQHMLYIDPGFGYEELLSLDPQLGQHGYTPAAAKAYLSDMRNRLLAVPGVESVSLIKLPPLGHVVTRMDIDINGHQVPVYPNWVEGGTFQTMGIPILVGRSFYPGEKNAVIVSESLARKQWPGQSPVGQKLLNGNSAQTVVGVVGNARINAMNDDDAVEQYWPAQPEDMPGMAMMVRTSGEPESVPAQVKSISESIDPKLFPEIRHVKVLYHDSVLQIEQITMVVSLIGVVAMLVAGVGIVGLVSFSVSQRMKELAIRMALGAKNARVLTAVLSQFAWPIVIGMVVGTGSAAAVSKVLRKFLFGVSNLDPLSYAGALCALGAIVALATVMPARKALRLDLAKVLHYE